LKPEAVMTATLAKGEHAGLRRAVHRHDELSRQGLLERAFTFAFRGLVYAQIWEDPAVDLEALQFGPDTHLVTIASGGCNVLSYLTANPRQITAVDLNTAHVALNRLKLVAARHLPDHASFYSFFGEANRPENVKAYREFVAPHLDETSRRYWEGRNLVGRQRIDGFGRNFYRCGLLGRFIGGAQLLARIYGIESREILAASSINEQRAIFETRFAPMFEKPFVRWLASNPASLFDLVSPQRNMRRCLGTSAKAWSRCCATGWRSSPAISTSARIISPGRPSAAAMARRPTRRCRLIWRRRTIARWSNGPTGSKFTI
jgi:S-adenosylmethionine-diacylglycerol 3-amino-3-carboxypropyl transferase